MNELYGALGLAAKANNVVYGYQAVVDAIAKGKIKLVLISCKMARNSVKKIIAACDYYNTGYRFVDMDDLGTPIGRSNKLVIGITSDSFAKMINNLDLNRGGTVEHE